MLWMRAMSLRPASKSTTTPTIVTASTSFHNFIAGSLSRHLPNSQFIPAPRRITPRTAFRLGHDGPMGIAPDAVASYVDRAIEAMADIVGDLGDDLANTRPGLPGANSPYAILRHCLGVMEFWGGQVVAGRTVDRDREAEFRASGPVAGLIAAAQAAQRRFRADLVTADPRARPRGGHPATGPDELEVISQGHALLHVMEEVCQHLGQMELTRDLLRQG
jgi:Protein of unknown function (DUF664)